MKPYLKRTLEDDILPVLESPKAIFILGARQVGKTSLLKRLMQFVGEDNSLLFDLEHPQLLHSFTTGIDDIVSLFELNRTNQNGKLYVFIDEIRYLVGY
ncbi:MAG: AAA family ATPase [Candidatus Cloacimonetes bacterium]|nr:AAA family ATPase [Candidatus Cloacimonadota bacterium]